MVNYLNGNGITQAQRDTATRHKFIKSNQINQKRIYIAPCIPQIQRRLADGRRNDTDKFLSVF